jgi:hypothetical protein
MDETEFFLARAARSFDVSDDDWFVFVSDPEHYAACPDDTKEILWLRPTDAVVAAERLLQVEGAIR